ncbi:MAG TPA: glycosyltransferase family 1 protein [Candidatus Limnocylindrales bacterium]|nr:glycosyltransferase family 1 protein [Candidatus Limnocylindrales bacterium]
MRELAASGDTIIETRGLPRVPRGRRHLRYVNAAGDIAWTFAGGRIFATRSRASAWFSPSNTLPSHLGRPAVVTIHDLNFLVPGTNYDERFRAYATRMFARSARSAQRIITVSGYSATMIADAFSIDPSRITVAYPGLDHVFRVTAASLPPFALRPFALFVGQTEPHKNIGLLIDAWASGVPRDLRLVIAGPPGRDHALLTGRARSGPASDRIQFLGRVPDEVLAALYERATCFLFPSLAEGFGLPPLEAMARGTVTAVAATTSLPEVTRDGAAHFDPHDAGALARLVTRLVEDAGLRARLADRGRAVALDYRWSRTAAAVWQAIRQAEADA